MWSNLSQNTILSVTTVLKLSPLQTFNLACGAKLIAAVHFKLTAQTKKTLESSGMVAASLADYPAMFCVFVC